MFQIVPKAPAATRTATQTIEPVTTSRYSTSEPQSIPGAVALVPVRPLGTSGQVALMWTSTRPPEVISKPRTPLSGTDDDPSYQVSFQVLATVQLPAGHL